MNELNSMEVEEVSGGRLNWRDIVLIIDLAVDFVNGVRDGINGK